MNVQMWSSGCERPTGPGIFGTEHREEFNHDRTHYEKSKRRRRGDPTGIMGGRRENRAVHTWIDRQLPMLVLSEAVLVIAGL